MTPIYLGLTIGQQVIQTLLVVFAIVFLAWSIKLTLEKD